MKDKRKAERISSNLKLISRKSGNSVDSHILNMSTEGAFIATSHLLSVDAEFALHMQLPGDSEIMTINARVVWTKAVSSASPAGMGIEFAEMLPEHQRKVAAFIAQNKQLQIGQEPVRVYV